jgi:hypothetical protein
MPRLGALPSQFSLRQNGQWLPLTLTLINYAGGAGTGNPEHYDAEII